MKIATIFVRYGDRQYSDSLKRIEDRFLLWGWTPSFRILVDNAWQVAPTEKWGDWRLIAGDNAGREFSGWQKAINQFRSELETVDAIQFATSAFEQPFAGYLDYYNKDLLSLAPRSAMIGHIDAYPEPIRAFQTVSRAWIRTSCFFLPASHVLKYGVWTAQDKQQFFSGDWRLPFKSSAPLDRRYQQFLIDWITGEGVGGGVWHSRFPLNADNLLAFEDKAMTIINEHLLSICARGAGLSFLDVGWMEFQRLAGASKLPRFGRSIDLQIRKRNSLYFESAQPTVLDRILTLI